MLDHLQKRHIILASQSPRRRHLLAQIGLDFEAVSADIDESIPEGMSPGEAAVFLAGKKADHFSNYLNDPRNIIITADTLVVIEGKILGKPEDHPSARDMLRTLSGRMHEVVTGVCVRDSVKSRVFTAWTEVWFKELDDREIEYYLANFQPYDKAGSYGIQEWIGYIAITRINGSFFNVMGLPVQRLYEELSRF
jgi:septum formation protein